MHVWRPDNGKQKIKPLGSRPACSAPAPPRGSSAPALLDGDEWIRFGATRSTPLEWILLRVPPVPGTLYCFGLGE